ncbi:MFS transporter [Gordonia sp. NPDC003504]
MSNSPPITTQLKGFLPPWLMGYAMVGMVVSGIVPILLPLSVESTGTFVVGAVVAAFYLGTLLAPIFGSFADRTGSQRLVFLVSFPVMAVGAIVFGLVDNAVVWFLCMLVAGAGAGAAQITASMFIVEGRPHSEWNDRIGWMRLAFGAGQVLGLAVSALFTRHLDVGWFVAGGLVGIGTLLGSLRSSEPPISCWRDCSPTTSTATCAPARPHGWTSRRRPSDPERSCRR